MKELYIPSSVNSVGDYAFSGCTILPTIIFDPNINFSKITIDPTAFINCTGLREVHNFSSGKLATDLLPITAKFFKTYTTGSVAANNNVKGSWSGAAKEGATLTIKSVDKNNYTMRCCCFRYFINQTG